MAFHIVLVFPSKCMRLHLIRQSLAFSQHAHNLKQLLDFSGVVHNALEVFFELCGFSDFFHGREIFTS